MLQADSRMPVQPAKPPRSHGYCLILSHSESSFKKREEPLIKKLQRDLPAIPHHCTRKELNFGIRRRQSTGAPCRAQAPWLNVSSQSVANTNQEPPRGTSGRREEIGYPQGRVREGHPCSHNTIPFERLCERPQEAEVSDKQIIIKQNDGVTIRGKKPNVALIRLVLVPGSEIANLPPVPKRLMGLIRAVDNDDAGGRWPTLSQLFAEPQNRLRPIERCNHHVRL